MKIFNWVHRKFNHNLIKDGFARNVKKTESIAIDTNTKALLEQAALVDVLDGWRDGILTIGTFGFDPLKSLDQPKEYFIFESDEEDEEEEEGGDRHDDSVDNNYHHDDDQDNSNINNIAEDDDEVNPLMFTTFEHNFVDMATSGGGNVEKTDMIMRLDGVPLNPTELGFDIADTTEGDQGKNRRRTTLADLFSEDSDIYKPNPNEFEPNITAGGKKQPAVRAKNGLSFAKKLIPHVKEDARPIRKLNQLMRRMLKRKIHPELECKAAQKSEGQNKASTLELLGKNNEAAESVSLLQIPDIATV